MRAVVATLKVNPDKTADFEAAFRQAMADVRANEPDCSLYQLCRSDTDPLTYVVMELYSDAAAQTTHRESPHFAALGSKLKGVLAGRPEVQQFDTVD